MIVEKILFYLVLLDSLFAVIATWFFSRWYKKQGLHRYFPLSKGWSALYLFLVMWIGFTLYRLGILF